MTPAYDEIVENGNQRPVGNMVYRGARHLCTRENTGPADTPEPIQGLNMRVPEIPPWTQIWSAIGVSPTPVAWTEVYSALQQGTAEAVEAPPGALNSAKLYEVIDHLNMTSHQITTGNIYVNENFYQGLDQTHKDLVQSAGDEATDHASQMAREQEQEFLDTFESEYGIGINDDADRESFASAAESAIKQLFEDDWAHTWEDIRNV
jgi:TRAP-type C4-dicarboxylate transport system substrate-binding protein